MPKFGFICIGKLGDELVHRSNINQSDLKCNSDRYEPRKLIFRTERNSKNFDLIYLIIWSISHKAPLVSLFVYLNDVPWASFYVYIIAEKIFLLYFG